MLKSSAPSEPHIPTQRTRIRRGASSVVVACAALLALGGCNMFSDTIAVKLEFENDPYYGPPDDVANVQKIAVDIFDAPFLVDGTCPADNSCGATEVAFEGGCVRCVDVADPAALFTQGISLEFDRDALVATVDGGDAGTGNAQLIARVDLLTADGTVVGSSWLQVDDQPPPSFLPIVKTQRPTPRCGADDQCNPTLDDEQQAVAPICSHGPAAATSSTPRTMGACATRPACPTAACAENDPELDDDTGRWDCRYSVRTPAICGEGEYCNPRTGCEPGVQCTEVNAECDLPYTCFKQVCSANLNCVNTPTPRETNVFDTECTVCADGTPDGGVPVAAPVNSGQPCTLGGADGGAAVCIDGTCELATCGDGWLSGDEVCDDGEANSDAPFDPSEDGRRPCRTDCRGVARYGDTIEDDGELCDDGNLDNNDHCVGGVPAECNDGYVNEATDGGEPCDDTNLIDTDNCWKTRNPDGSYTCHKNVANDGILDLECPDTLEECADNGIPFSECNHICEPCDDGDHNPNNGCDNSNLPVWTGTVIGGGSRGGGTAQDLSFRTFPSALAVDEAGNVVAALPSESRVVRIHVEGDDAIGPRPAYPVSLVAGVGEFGIAKPDVTSSANAPLLSPVSVSVDGLGTAYIVDREANRVYAVQDGHVFDPIAGRFAEYDLGDVDGGTINDNDDPLPSDAIPLSRPIDVTTDGLGHVYLADQYAGRVRRINTLTSEMVDLANQYAPMLRKVDITQPPAADGTPVLEPGVFVDDDFDNLSVVTTTPAGDLLISDHTSNHLSGAGLDGNSRTDFRVFLLATPTGAPVDDRPAYALWTEVGGQPQEVEFFKVYDLAADEHGLYQTACRDERVLFFPWVDGDNTDPYWRAQVGPAVVLKANPEQRAYAEDDYSCDTIFEEPLLEEHYLAGATGDLADGGFSDEERARLVDDFVRRPFFLAVDNDRNVFVSELNGRIRRLRLDDDHNVVDDSIIAGAHVAEADQRSTLELKVIKSAPNATTVFNNADVVDDHLEFAGRGFRPQPAFLSMTGASENVVLEIRDNSRVSYFHGDARAPEAAALVDPQALAYDEGGHLWVADRGNDRVAWIERKEVCQDGWHVSDGKSYSKYDLQGDSVVADVLLTVTPPDGLELSRPQGVWFEPGSCVSDDDCYDADAQCISIAAGSQDGGERPSRDVNVCARLDQEDICGRRYNEVRPKKNDRLYIADTGNHRILSIEPYADVPTFHVVVGLAGGTPGTFDRDPNPLEQLPGTSFPLRDPVGVVVVRESDFLGGDADGGRRIMVVIDRFNHAVPLLLQEEDDPVGEPFKLMTIIGKPGYDGYVDVAGSAGSLKEGRFSYPRGLASLGGELIIIDGQDRLRALRLDVEGFDLSATVTTVSQGSFSPGDDDLPVADLGRPQQMVLLPDTQGRQALYADGLKGRLRLLSMGEQACNEPATRVCNLCELTPEACVDFDLSWCNGKPVDHVDTAVGLPLGKDPNEAPEGAVFAREFNINGETTGVALDVDTQDLYFATKNRRAVVADDDVAATGVFRIQTGGFARGPLVGDVVDGQWAPGANAEAECRFEVCHPGESYVFDADANGHVCAPWLVEELDIGFRSRRGLDVFPEAPGNLAVMHLDGKTVLLLPDEEQHTVFGVDVSDLGTVGTSPSLPGYAVIGTPGTQGRLESLAAVDEDAGVGCASDERLEGVPCFDGSLLSEPFAVAFTPAASLDTAAACDDNTVATNPTLYIADTGNHQVVRADLHTGEMAAVAGNGFGASTSGGSPSSAFPLHTPRGLDTDAYGNLFVAAFGSVHVLSPAPCTGVMGDGRMSTVYGAPPRNTYPESATDCLRAVQLVDDDTLLLMDACQGVLLRASKTLSGVVP